MYEFEVEDEKSHVEVLFDFIAEMKVVLKFTMDGFRTTRSP